MTTFQRFLHLYTCVVGLWKFLLMYGWSIFQRTCKILRKIPYNGFFLQQSWVSDISASAWIQSQFSYNLSCLWTYITKLVYLTCCDSYNKYL